MENTITVEDTVKLLEYYNALYREGSPEVTDEDYDVLVEQLRKEAPDHPFLNNVETDLPLPMGETASKGRITHPAPMLSADKAYTTKEVEKWLNKVIKAGAELNITPECILIEISGKLDGIAGRFNQGLQQLVTRGDGEAGTDISEFFRKGVVITRPVGSVVFDDTLGELVVKKAYFERHLSEHFSHSRNFIAGIAGATNINEHGLKALEAGAIELVVYKDMNKTFLAADIFMGAFEFYEESHLESLYDLDGVIFDVQDPLIREFMGCTSHHPNWRLAKKRTTDVKETTVRNIRWQVGRTGKITPVLEVDEIELSGAKVTSITAHNAGVIFDYRLGIGAVIKATRAGEVIPKLLKTMKEAPVTEIINTVPSTCPCCGETTYFTNQDKFLNCPNKSCAERLSSQLQHSFKLLGIDLFGPRACDKLVKFPISDILKFNQCNFTSLGFGDGQAQNFVDEISRVKREPIKDSHILASLGIPHLGRAASEKILTKFRIGDLHLTCVNDLLSIDGFAEKTARSIVNDLVKELDELYEIISGQKVKSAYGITNFNILHTQDQLKNVDHSSGLSGLTVVFTGKMLQGNRKEMEADAKSKGAIVQSSVSSKTKLLVCGENAGSKLAKAEKLGIEVITEVGYNERFC